MGEKTASNSKDVNEKPLETVLQAKSKQLYGHPEYCVLKRKRILPIGGQVAQM